MKVKDNAWTTLQEQGPERKKHAQVIRLTRARRFPFLSLLYRHYFCLENTLPRVKLPDCWERRELLPKVEARGKTDGLSSCLVGSFATYVSLSFITLCGRRTHGDSGRIDNLIGVRGCHVKVHGRIASGTILKTKINGTRYTPRSGPDWWRAQGE